MTNDFDYDTHGDIKRLIAAARKVDENLADQLAQADHLCNALRRELAEMASPAYLAYFGYPEEDATCTNEEMAAAELLLQKNRRDMTRLIIAARKIGGLPPFVFAD